MPVIFNEPLSFLQRMVEYMEYAHLLRRASEEADPICRMQVGAVFSTKYTQVIGNYCFHEVTWCGFVDSYH
jgi:hypothetical protein